MSDDVRIVPLPPDEEGRPREALVVRASDGELRCYLNLCKHLPVPLDGGSREFLDPTGRYLVCGTHGALYRLEDGHCVEGPCVGTTLTPLEFTVRPDGSVVVDV